MYLPYSLSYSLSLSHYTFTEEHNDTKLPPPLMWKHCLVYDSYSQLEKQLNPDVDV